MKPESNDRQYDDALGRHSSLKRSAALSHNGIAIESWLREMITQNPVAAIAIGVGLGGMLKRTVSRT